MTPPPAARGLDDVILTEAPVAARRAASIMVAVARAATRLEASGRQPGRVAAGQVRLAADGSVTIDATGEHDADGSCGASMGSLLFALLTGREPLGRMDAYEPSVLDALSPRLHELMARSLSDAPGQWPTAAQWCHELEAHAAGLAPPLPPSDAARLRRRRLLLALGMALLLAASLTSVLLVPRWLDATEEGAPRAPAREVQSSRTSS